MEPLNLDDNFRLLRSDGELSQDTYTLRELQRESGMRLIFENEETLVFSDSSGIQCVFILESKEEDEWV